MNEEEKKVHEKELKKKVEEKKKKDKEEAEIKAAKDDRARRRAEHIERGEDPEEHGVPDSEEEIKIDDLPTPTAKNHVRVGVQTSFNANQARGHHLARRR